MFKSTMLVAAAVGASAVLGFGITESGAMSGAEGQKPRSLAQLAAMAIDKDPAVAGEAIAELRAAGQEGLDALFMNHPELVLDATDFTRHDEPELERWRTAVDQVARQRDAAFSRLYWYTDLDEAKSVAQETGKPILSLRLLGNLDEDRTCANSRYFRTLLYPDPAVSKMLRDRFVLHWQSVRPVPFITVDMGDGRRIERTITGNSVHYVLKPSGEVVDVLPGLMSPEAFDGMLTNALTLDLTADPDGEAAAIDIGFKKVNAVNAARRAVSKSMGESVLVNEVASIDARRAERDDLVRSLRDVYRIEPVTISPASQRLMWQKRFAAKTDRNDPEQNAAMQRMTEQFRRTVAQDTVLNRDSLRRTALQWLRESGLRFDVNQFNERVYAELFLTPLDDPWMGLVPEDAYAGLDGEGLVGE